MIDDDESLVDRAVKGDRNAVDRLLHDHYDMVRAVCHRIVTNRTDAEDATQQAMISIAGALPRFDGRSKFSTWAYRIATNASLDELRRRGRRPALAIADDDGPTELVDTTSWRFDEQLADRDAIEADRKSTRLNSSH